MGAAVDVGVVTWWGGCEGSPQEWRERARGARHGRGLEAFGRAGSRLQGGYATAVHPCSCARTGCRLLLRPTVTAQLATRRALLFP